VKAIRLLPVIQEFEDARLADIEGHVQIALDKAGLGNRLRPGARVALTAGSRGLGDGPAILAAACRYVRRRRAVPVVVAAMGAHGGGTVEGQKRVLHKLGVTPEALQCDIVAAEDAEPAGSTPEGHPVWLNPAARSCDLLFVINRVRPHTWFSGPVQSGPLKMLCVGLGGKSGAHSTHRAATPETFARFAIDACRVIAGQVELAGALAIVENAFGATARLAGIAPERLAAEEPGLLREARERMPRLPVGEVDLLILDEIGKNISGTGFDTNLAGRKTDSPVCVRRILVRGLSSETLGNACGIGLADVTTRGVVEAIDFEATYLNTRMSGLLDRARVPMVL
jgi:hypothetical protein